jgi:GxxExxY protein
MLPYQYSFNFRLSVVNCIFICRPPAPDGRASLPGRRVAEFMAQSIMDLAKAASGFHRISTQRPGAAEPQPKPSQGDCSRRGAENAEKILNFNNFRLPFSALSATLRGNIWIMELNEVTAQIVDAAYKIHTQLGPGLLETVYEVTLAHELRKRGLRVRRQVPVPIEFDRLKFDEGFRMDLLVEEAVVVEIKSVEKNHPVHPKQLRTHLVLANLHLGLVLNFGLERMKDGITRIVNKLPEQPSPTEKIE